ncbi:MAG: zinc ribbon domain-containing protein [Deltaproteobacteria bacterium]|nr:MAG: zinc ribbon domain-containing protein [Deltaproteobacteria bacterium]
MPLIEFCCSSCDEKVEELVRKTAGATPPKCPSCGSEMERAWSVFGTSSKGSACSPGSTGGFS